MNTRKDILDYLTRHQTATAVQMGYALQLSTADIRHHLARLSREGLVEQAGVTSTGERGRPRNLYRLAIRARHDNLAGLASSLLNLLSEQGNSNLFDRLAGYLARETPENAGRGQRLVQAIQQLNQLHYDARWEAHAGAPVILFGNCPYAPIINDHPELCRLDAVLLTRLTGLHPEQTAKLRPNALGAIQCIFRMAEQPGNRAK